MATIKSYFEPASLYRYRSLESFDREIDAIRQKSLHCAPYLDLNDPMEGFYTTNPLQKGSENYQIFREKIADSKTDLGICSFSEVHDNEIMWAHYSKQFTGICIAYDFKRLLPGLDEDTEFVRLSYRDKAPSLSLKENSDHLAKRILSCKSYKWLYEREWRMFAKREKVNYEQVSCVQCVYLGSRISEPNKTKVMSEMKLLGIKTKTMSIDEYSMVFRPCN